MKNKRKNIIILIFIIIIIIAGSALFSKYIIPLMHSQKEYTAQNLEIGTVLSENDKDNDGLDDYTDIREGAISYVETHPEYKSKYYSGGYPDDGYGVCTDVIWKAFEAAGYDLKALIDYDISQNTEAYSQIETPDPNIDFRRVKNLKIFFDRNALSLPTDFSNPEDWQAGDIVVFSNHIAICSDKRNSDGIPFIIHHDSLGARERNDIEKYEITGHYRWTGSTSQ